MAKWINRTAVTPTVSTTTHTVTFTAATAGNFLVCYFVVGATASTPTGWTLPTNGNQVGDVGLYVWTKTATSGETTFTTTVGASGFTSRAFVYEFPAGTTLGSVVGAATGNATVANPALTGLSGSPTVFAVVAGDNTTAGLTTSWDVGTEDFDLDFITNGSTHIYFSGTYVDNYSTASFTATGTISGAVTAKARYSLSLNVPGGTNAATMSASVPRVTASLIDGSSNPAGLSAKTPNVTASISGVLVQPGTGEVLWVRGDEGQWHGFTSGGTINVDSGTPTTVMRREQSIAGQIPTLSSDVAVTVKTGTTSSVTSDLGSPVSSLSTASALAAAVRFSRCRQGTPDTRGGTLVPKLARQMDGYDTYGQWTYDFMLDSAAAEIHMLNFQTLRIYSTATVMTPQARVWVDGVLELDWTSTNAANHYLIKITPTSRRPMHVRIDTNLGWVNLNLSSGEKVWKPSRSIFRARVAVTGDSWIAAGRDATSRGLDNWLGDTLGWETLRVGYSSTGYTVSYSGDGSNGTTPNYAGRVSTDLAALHTESPLDLVIVYGSINDNGSGSVASGVTAMLDAMDVSLPGVPRILVGPPAGLSGITLSQSQSNQAAIASAASGRVLAVVDNTTWLTTGDGLDSGDGAHPSAVGHRYLGERLADVVSGLLIAQGY